MGDGGGGAGGGGGVGGGHGDREEEAGGSWLPVVGWLLITGYVGLQTSRRSQPQWVDPGQSPGKCCLPNLSPYPVVGNVHCFGRVRSNSAGL